jgi:diguanylate cyclase (GGDEF)-like protein/PAS domain S-box-containing protein
VDGARFAGGGDLDVVGWRVFERALAESVDAVCIAVARSGGAHDLAAVYVNDAFVQLTGYTPDLIVGSDPLALLHGTETCSSAVTALRAAVSAGDAGQIEALHYRNDGTQFFAEVRFVPVRDGNDGVTHWIFACRDATERWLVQSEMVRLQLLESELADAARRDELTGLPNRTLFVARLRASIDAARACGVARAAALFLDVDRFKLVNDTFGHLAGDRLLVAVARRLERYVRRTDIVARIGGDEFMVLLDGVDDEQHAAALGRRIIDGLAEPFMLENSDTPELRVTSSIGIAMVHGTYTDPDDVLRDADAAMYHAKSLGRGHCAVFAREMRARRSTAPSGDTHAH